MAKDYKSNKDSVVKQTIMPCNALADDCTTAGTVQKVCECQQPHTFKSEQLLASSAHMLVAANSNIQLLHAPVSAVTC
jgi:hypothetical protein